MGLKTLGHDGNAHISEGEAGTRTQPHSHTSTKKPECFVCGFLRGSHAKKVFSVCLECFLVVNREFILQLSSRRCWTFVIKSCYLSAVYRGD